MSNLNRRVFLAGLLASGAGVAAAPRGESVDSLLFREQTKRGFSILQGMTDETSAQFSLILPKGAWLIDVSGGTAASLVLNASVSERPYSGYDAHKLEVSGLELGVQYTLRVRDTKGTIWDERQFRALDLRPRSVRIGFLSCILDLLHRDDIWRRLETQKLDAVFFLGDNVYADRISFITKRPADEKQLWERYVLTRNRVAFYYQKNLVPVIATWDDHDFGADNAYRDFPAAAASREIFEIFFAQGPRPALAAGPGIARRFSAFGADFVFCDGRSFRDPVSGPDAMMFGAEQEAWIVGAASADRPTWLLNGSLFFGAYQTCETFEREYAPNFGSFLGALAASPTLCMFASGDVHFSELMDIEASKLGYPTIELVASSVHSYTFPGHENRYHNPRRRHSASVHNFVVFTGEFSAGRVDGELAAHSATGIQFRTSLALRR